MKTLGKLDPTTLTLYADAVVTRLEDAGVRKAALETLAKLEPATLAQHADAVAARLEDSDRVVRVAALETLGKLDPTTLTLYADAVVTRLEDSRADVRKAAGLTLHKVGPATLGQHAGVLAAFRAYGVVASLEDAYLHLFRRDTALETLRQLPPLETLRQLPRFVTRGVDFTSEDLRSRLLGRLAWYKCRLRLRVERVALYWYALPYRPSGPGHARDVEAWSQMLVE